MMIKGSLFGLLVTLFIGCTAAGALPVSAAENDEVPFIHQEELRHYRIHVPDSVTGKLERPLLLCFHGGGGNPRQIERHTGFSGLADRNAFIVVYPKGLNGHWNDGRNSEKFEEQDARVDDAAFILDLLKKLSEEYPIDEKRVYVVGISNGGMFTQKLAIEHADLFAAAAFITSSIPKPLKKTFAPAMPVPVLFMNGTADPIMPYYGGAVTIEALFNQDRRREVPDRGSVLSTDESVYLWVARNGAHTIAQVTEIPDPVEDDGSSAEKHLWPAGDAGASVVLYKIIGGGHTLPGGKQFLPRKIVGNSCRDFDGAEAIWKFLSKHRRVAAIKMEEPEEPMDAGMEVR